MDDLSFGNVWGDDSSPQPPPSTLLPKPSEQPVVPVSDDFNDFTEFGQPSGSTSSAPHGSGAAQDDDDFGDFGDFGDAPIQTGDLGAFDDDGFGTAAGFASTSFALPPQNKTWQPLRLQPLPSPGELSKEVDELLEPIWADVASAQVLTQEGIRQVEGPAQVLVTPESRQLYHLLLETPLPPTRPPNWTRSRIRRQHLIALGIPINLDEVLPHANGKPLPALHITTRPSSAPPTPRPAPATVATGSVTRSSTPKLSQNNVAGRKGSTGLGSLPVLDQAKVDEMLALDPETLPLMPLPMLNGYLDTLRGLTATTSSILTHLLQTRESLQQDSESYNRAIADLISKQTQKLKAGSGRTKRGSMM
ncbi:hypothetical protein FRB99_007894 [Tulasnella sp. 403]|nr:hypothetical protein FRB99_007894 [Tulasnella sp. 403]